MASIQRFDTPPKRNKTVYVAALYFTNKSRNILLTKNPFMFFSFKMQC